MAGVIVVVVDGESTASTTCASEGKVMIGGRLVGACVGVATVGWLCGLSPGEYLDSMRPFRCGGGDCELAKPPSEPKDPDGLLAELFLLFRATDDLLDAVDCDHLFKLPMPSVIPLALFGRLCTALARRLGSGDSVRVEMFAEVVLVSIGLCGLSAVGTGPLRDDKDIARFTVTTEDETEFGLEELRCCDDAFVDDEAIVRRL